MEQRVVGAANRAKPPVPRAPPADCDERCSPPPMFILFSSQLFTKVASHRVSSSTLGKLAKDTSFVVSADGQSSKSL